MNINLAIKLEEEYKSNEVIIYDLNESLTYQHDYPDPDEFLSLATTMAWYEGRQDLISEILEYD